MTPAQFENKTGLSGYDAHLLLRVSKSKYYEWRRGDREVPDYITASMEAHACLRKDTLAKLLARRKSA